MTKAPIRIVVVEDQPVSRRHIVSLLMAEPNVQVVGDYGDVDAAISGINEKLPELVLLDIQLGERTGFEVLERISVLPKVIFLTAYEQHAIRAIKYGALDYLLKPLNMAELREAMLRVRPVQEEQYKIAFDQYAVSSRRIVIASQHYLQVIALDDLLYCRSDGGYTSFILSDGSKIVASKNLKDYETILPKPAFVKVHQSYMVNMSFVGKYRKDGMIVLRNGTEIPVSVRRREEIVSYLREM